MHPLASKTMVRAGLAALVAAVTWLVACAGEGSQPTAEQPATPAKSKEPEVPAEMQAVAEASLGLEVSVLKFGDLALTGEPQVLAANLLKTTPTGVAPGTLFTRAVIVASSKGQWQEVFRCDEHLKNPKGFLGGTPLAAVNGWRLQSEMSKEKGLIMYFTPIRQPASGTVKAIAVRWNPKVKRYQSLDRNYQNFVGEVPTLENPESHLR